MEQIVDVIPPFFLENHTLDDKYSRLVHVCVCVVDDVKRVTEGPNLGMYNEHLEFLEGTYPSIGCIHFHPI